MNTESNSARVVLVVEDQDDDVFFLKLAFEDAKISNPIEVAADCSEAMQYLSGQGKFADRKRFPLPALILLDLKLPDDNGLELLRWMQRLKTRSIPVIVFTSSSNIADVKAAYGSGRRLLCRQAFDVRRTAQIRLVGEGLLAGL